MAISALAGGLLLDAVAGGRDLGLPALQGGHGGMGMGMGWLDHVWAGLLVLVMAWAFRPRAGSAACCDHDHGPHAGDAPAETVELVVRGMTCSHCAASVESTLKAQDGVRRVTVDLAAGRAVVTGDSMNPAAIAAAVNALGFEATDSTASC